jgi:hypothetical protein
MNLKEQLLQRYLDHLGDLIERYKSIIDFQQEYCGKDINGEYILNNNVRSMYRAYVTRAYKTIMDITGSDSTYSTQAQVFYEGMDHHFVESIAAVNMASLAAELRNELELGSLDSITELLHATIFDDFISMAQHLIDEGYKDAAAVICGGTLESHLRRLCSRKGIDTTENDKHKKVQRLNQDLGKVAYSRYDQKMVTAWLDIRNSAAHGHYDDYSSEHVQQFIDWLQDFIKRNPA